jgi:hypothetical protein
MASTGPAAASISLPEAMRDRTARARSSVDVHGTRGRGMSRHIHVRARPTIPGLVCQEAQAQRSLPAARVHRRLRLVLVGGGSDNRGAGRPCLIAELDEVSVDASPAVPAIRSSRASRTSAASPPNLEFGWCRFLTTSCVAVPLLSLGAPGAPPMDSHVRRRSLRVFRRRLPACRARFCTVRSSFWHELRAGDEPVDHCSSWRQAWARGRLTATSSWAGGLGRGALTAGCGGGPC